MDNIIPAPPTDLSAFTTMNSGENPQMHIFWNYLQDIDFAYHQTNSMYGGPSYSTTNNNLIELTTPYEEFYVNSVDIHGNHSAPTNDRIGSHYTESLLELVSFSVLPENTSLDNIFPDTGVIIEIIGEGVAATNYLDLGGVEYWNWLGALNHIDPSRGYWIRTSEETVFTTIGEKQIITEFDLHEGSNLISYTCPDFGSVQELISNDCVEAILGQGVAAYSFGESGWSGSLSMMEPGKGYWFKTTEPIEFQFVLPESRASGPIKTPKNISFIEFNLL